MTDIPESLIAEAVKKLAGCDDAAELREKLAEFLPVPVDPLALTLSDIVEAWNCNGPCYDIRAGVLDEYDLAAIEVLRQTIAAATTPVDDDEVAAAIGYSINYTVPGSTLGASLCRQLRVAGFSIIRTPAASPQSGDGNTAPAFEAGGRGEGLQS